MKRILVFTITTALVLLATAQLSIMALNNISSGERTFQMGRYLIPFLNNKFSLTKTRL